MDEEILLRLEPDSNECAYGESLFFWLTLRCTRATQPLTVADLNRDYRCVRLVLVDAEGRRRSADRISSMERDGEFVESAYPSTITLRPQQELRLRGDLLTWFGEIAPGKYRLSAEYLDPGLPTEAEPVELNVRRRSVTAMWTPRSNREAPAVHESLTWLGKQGDGFRLVYQLNSGCLARNVRHALHVCDVGELIEAWPATFPLADAKCGHAVWLDRRGRLQFSTIDLKSFRAGPVRDVRPPYEGRPLTSPASMPDAGVWIPITGIKRERVALVHMDAKGGAASYELDLGQTKPLGPYVCFWDYDGFLHFAWTTPNGWDVQHARLSLADPASGFATRGLYLSNEPILGLEAYMDLDAPLEEERRLRHSLPPEELEAVAELLSPTLMLWCVSQVPGQLTCTRISVTEGSSQPVLAFATSGLSDLCVHRSAVTYKQDLVLILADSDKQLYYASTGRRTLLPLAEVTGKELTLDDCPGLLASSRAATRPWVYLTYIDRQEGTIGYIRLEPEDELDPIERE